MHDSEQADSDSELSKKKSRINLLILVTARAQYSEPFKFNIVSEG